MDLLGLAGVLASLLGLSLTVYGVFFNGRATRSLITRTHAETQALITQTHADTSASIEAARQDTRLLVEAIRSDIQAVHQNGQRRHDDLVTYLQDMDRRHTELLIAMGTSGIHPPTQPRP